MNGKALIAMSGGVDSSVAALLMHQKGYECIGVTMKLFHNEDLGESGESTCCSLSDIEDARNVAQTIGIPYYVFNFTVNFNEQVIGRFITAYERGETPNPCIDCNRYIKFEGLFQRAKELGFDYVVTGHYARITYHAETGRYLLRKAADDTKDQSYVLYSMTQEQLSHAHFPLGELRKSQTREIAEKYGFINAGKHDSQDICFVPSGDYAEFMERYTGKTYPAGDFVDSSGHVLGKHKGLVRYTIGQRKGLGLSLREPLYVCSKSTTDNTVTLGREEDLYSKALTATEINLISCERFETSVRLKAKVRYKQEEQWAMVDQLDGNTLHIEFDKPQRAITKGQAVVLYDGDIVVGGGTIG